MPGSRDARLKALLILALLGVDCLLLVRLNLQFALQDALMPVGVACGLGAVAFFYHRIRRIPKFVWCLVSMVHLVTFTSGYTLLMYSLAATSRPLVDSALVRADSWLAFNAATFHAWADGIPLLRIGLGITYNTLLEQTALIVIVLGFAGDRRHLESFTLLFMLTALVTAVLFYLFPAEGPFVAYGFTPNLDQAAYLEHFRGMRSGERTLITLQGAEGLITFPSFHTVWAVLLAMSLRHRRVLFAFAALLNLSVVVATLSTGWHYLSDVVAGLAVWGLCMLLLPWIDRWRYPDSTSAAEEPADDPHCSRVPNEAP